jgi:hypothetical protein
MPYSVPLDQPPTFPSSQAAIVDARGFPTREFATWMNAMREWQERVQKALEQLEP